MTSVRQIFCGDGNPAFARCAVGLGWLYGARLPATVYQWPYFADQDWRSPNRAAYMNALAVHRPVMATVLDWKEPEQLSEVLSWAEEAASHVEESVVVIPKVSGQVDRIPARIGGKRVVLGYSVPTSYGATPLCLWEFSGWPVHLLGGMPHKQMDCWRYLSGCSEVVSADGNSAHQQAHKCRFWSRKKAAKGHWIQLQDTGDMRTEGANLECFRRSLVEIREAWDSVCRGRRR